MKQARDTMTPPVKPSYRALCQVPAGFTFQQQEFLSCLKCSSNQTLHLQNLLMSTEKQYNIKRYSLKLLECREEDCQRCFSKGNWKGNHWYNKRFRRFHRHKLKIVLHLRSIRRASWKTSAMQHGALPHKPLLLAPVTTGNSPSALTSWACAVLARRKIHFVPNQIMMLKGNNILCVTKRVLFLLLSTAQMFSVQQQ